MGIEFLQNHIALSSSAEVDQICKPLKKLGITYFSFVRSFKDGSHIRLANNPMWTQHYYKKGFYNVVINQIRDADGNLLWSCIDRYPLFQDASEHFNVDNGTVMVMSVDDVVERYFFGGTRDNTQVNYIYLNKLDLLKRFIIYFKEMAAPLINKATETKIIIPPVICNSEDENFYNDSVIQEFLDEIQVKKVCVRVQGQDIYITQNDAKILSLMKCGYSSKAISQEIGLKQKTVEIYRDKLKEKLNQYSRSNLMAVANSNGLLKLDLLK